MRETSKFDDLIDFTLNYHEKGSKYKVFFLSPEEYAEYQIGNRLYMELGKLFMIENLKFLQNFYKDYPDYHKKYEKNLKEFKTADDIEYGRVQKVSEIIKSRAACIELDDLEDLSSPMPFGVINGEYSLFFEIKNLKNDVDFVIIINEDLFSIQKENDQKRDIIHEAFHIVEYLNGGISHHHMDTEPIIIEILNRYHEHIYKDELSHM